MGRSLGVGLLLTFFCFTLNNSANAYTKKNLENLQLGSAIGELVLSMPFLLDRNLNTYKFALSFPADILERQISCTLEKDTHLISELTILLKHWKIHPNFLVARFIATCLFRLSNVVIKSIWHRSYKERSDRRFVRAIINSFIGLIVFAPIFKDDSFRQYLDASPAETFITLLLSNGLGEYIGEKIIQGTEEESSARHIY